MNRIESVADRAVNYLSTIRISDVVDILIVSLLIFELIMLMRRTHSTNLAKGLLIFLLALWISEIARLTMINYLLKRALELGVIALVVLFQPEIRRFLERIGARLSTGRLQTTPALENALSEITSACETMSHEKTGALIIFERGIKLNDIIETGTAIDASASAELIKNIFYNKAPLHDGAMVIRNGRIAASGCILPLTKNKKLSKDLGMRHRAGIGVSEQSDALVVIISEETGSISVTEKGMLKRHLTPEMLNEVLHQGIVIDSAQERKSISDMFFYLIAGPGKPTGEKRNEEDT